MLLLLNCLFVDSVSVFYLCKITFGNKNNAIHSLVKFLAMKFELTTYEMRFNILTRSWRLSEEVSRGRTHRTGLRMDSVTPWDP